jgi:hypothetical protein
LFEEIVMPSYDLFDQVIRRSGDAAQRDLVEMVHELRQVACVKG